MCMPGPKATTAWEWQISYATAKTLIRDCGQHVTTQRKDLTFISSRHVIRPPSPQTVRPRARGPHADPAGIPSPDSAAVLVRLFVSMHLPACACGRCRLFFVSPSLRAYDMFQHRPCFWGLSALLS
jgi:hypothetical protein